MDELSIQNHYLVINVGESMSFLLPWLGMVDIPPIKMVIRGMVYYCFTHINKDQ